MKYLQEGFSPLGAAVSRGHTVVVEILMKYGADVDIKDKVMEQDWISYLVPLHAALSHPHSFFILCASARDRVIGLPNSSIL